MSLFTLFLSVNRLKCAVSLPCQMNRMLASYSFKAVLKLVFVLMLGMTTGSLISPEVAWASSASSVTSYDHAFGDNTQTIKAGERVDLRVGETLLLSADSVRRVAIGNGKLAEVHLLKDQGQILLIGNAMGITDLRVWDKHNRHTRYQLHVDGASKVTELEQIRALLANARGVSLREAGGIVIVEGEDVSPHDIQLIEQLKERFPMLINRTVSAATGMQEMVLLDVKVVEMHRRSLSSIGIRWAGSIPGPNVSVTGGVVQTGLTTFLSSDLKLLEERGVARVLAEPRLLARSGTRAEFLAGGEVPLPVTVDGQTTVVFKDYGVILNMEPLVHPQGFIATKIEIEVSNIDPAVQVLGIPGFQTRKTDTYMNVESGQTVVLAGLLNRHDSKSVSRVPLLANMPIIGELFKSRDFLNEETELVVFVTPSLVSPASLATRDDLRYAQQLRDNTVDAVRFDIMD